jgi:hypothetical protein
VFFHDDVLPQPPLPELPPPHPTVISTANVAIAKLVSPIVSLLAAPLPGVAILPPAFPLLLIAEKESFIGSEISCRLPLQCSKPPIDNLQLIAVR